MFSPFEVENIFTRKRNVYMWCPKMRSHIQKEIINVEVIF